jgi:succinate-semialdehyde dehydrogenase/glutarate-semialdehyde dehydrogenase
MGKVLFESISEVEKSAANCDFYAENAEIMLKGSTMTHLSKACQFMIQWGCFAIMPWNYPFWQVLRYAAPVIMSGNVTLLKHAPNVIGCAKLSKMRFGSRFSRRCFQQITIDIPLVENVIASNIVQGITLTEVKWQDPQ